MTLDYVLAPHRWTNAIQDVETDPYPNIYTDHYPLKMKIKVKLTGIQIHTTTPNAKSTN